MTRWVLTDSQTESPVNPDVELLLDDELPLGELVAAVELGVETLDDAPPSPSPSPSSPSPVSLPPCLAEA